MNAIKIHDLPGGLRIGQPTDAAVDSAIHTMPLQSAYYLPLVNYSKQIMTPTVAIGDYVKGGDLLAPGIVAPTSGVVTERVNMDWAHPSNTQAPTLVLQADGEDKFAGYKKLDAASISTTQLIQRLEQCAIHGLGGAAFNTANKIQKVLQHPSPTLIVNAVECEPGICCDDALMRQHSSQVVSACINLKRMLGGVRTLFAIEDDKQDSIQLITRSMQSHNTPFEFVTLPAVYPSGAENPLVQRLTGTALAHNEKAADIGVLCLNVATVVAIDQAIQGLPVVDRILTVSSQDLMHSVNVRAKFGTSISHVLDFAASLSSSITTSLKQNSSTVSMGGPLSGFSKPINHAPVQASTNALLVGTPYKTLDATACIRCAECATVCPVNLLPQELYSAAAAQDLQSAQRYALSDCLLCGCCDLVCPAHIPLTPWFRFAKDLARQQQQDTDNATIAKQRSEKHERRVQQRAQEKAAADAERRAAAAQKKQSSEDIKAALARVKKKKPRA